MAVKTLDFTKSKALAARARQLIPAGCHTYSKGDDQFPQEAPGLISRASGARAWDVDGNEFLDWGMGLRSVVLGHGYERVVKAATEQMRLGTNFTRPAPIEADLAELLVELVPSAEMVKLSKNGSDVTTAAVRLARAHTGRKYVALCKEHPFFSFDDWFIGTTPPNNGIPQETTSLSLTFHYNKIETLESLFSEYPDQIACVILEPVTTEPPVKGFLEGVRALTERHGAVLIFDEMISGFRWHLNGAQAYFGVIPDLATFGKAIGNGFSVSALVGRRDIMDLGGLTHDKPKVFLLSATHGAETHALAAAIATLSELRDRDVVSHLWKIGDLLQKGINDAAREAGLAEYIGCYGYPCSPFIVARDHEKNVSLPFRTLMLQEMIRHGVLIPYISVSFAHGVAEVGETISAFREMLRVYERALEEGVGRHLLGPAVKPVFRRFN